MGWISYYQYFNPYNYSQNSYCPHLTYEETEKLVKINNTQHHTVNDRTARIYTQVFGLKVAMILPHCHTTVIWESI